MDLLRMIGKKENDIALTIEITNKNIARYVAEYIDDNDIKLDKKSLNFLFDETIETLIANILENFGTELKEIVPAIAEKNGLADTYYWRLP